MLDAFANTHGGKFKIDRHGYVCKVKYRGRICVLLKPTTFMNLSGKAIKYWLAKEKIPIENSLTVTDDIALPLGAIRIKIKGGDGGHNGLISIISSLQHSNFPRLRIGIGNDFAQGYQSDYVLGKWTQSEEKTVIPRVELAVEVIRSFIAIGIERTMNLYN